MYTRVWWNIDFFLSEHGYSCNWRANSWYDFIYIEI